VPPTTRSTLPPLAGIFGAIAVLAGLLGACATSALPSSSPSGTVIVHPSGATDLVLRYEEVGGFMGPNRLLARQPIVSVYGDGTIITPGAVDAMFPGPALPNLRATKVTEAGLQRLLAAAALAGLLGPDVHYDANGIADASTAQFTLVAAGSRHVISAYALGIASPDQEGGPAASAARAKLRVFAAALGDLRSTLAPEVIGAEAPYAFTSLRIFAAPGAPQSGDPAVSRPPLAWPLGTPLATFGAPATGAAASFRCGVVSGPDLETLRPLLAQATSITGWASRGSVYTLILQPMLPDDPGC
jgi:hypothetical protein